MIPAEFGSVRADFERKEKKPTGIGGGIALLPQVSTQPIKKQDSEKYTHGRQLLPIQEVAGLQWGGFSKTGRRMAVSLGLRGHTSRPASDTEERAPLVMAPAWAFAVSAAPA